MVGPGRPVLARAGRVVAGAVVCVLLTVGSTACGRTAPPPGSLAANGLSLAGQTYRVGGKNFPEQLVLCQITLVAMRSLGATAEDRCEIASGAATRAALTPTEQIDVYWEYTATGATILAPLRTGRDPDAVFAAVRDADAARNGVVWLRPAPFDDTYALAVSRPTAGRLGVRTVSDWARLVRSGSKEATTCVEPEFAERPDGLRGLLGTYGVSRSYDGPPEVSEVDAGVVYSALARGTPCTFGEVFSTDGRVRGRDLVLLTDDRGHFLPYNAAPTLRRDVLERAPGLAGALEDISSRLTDDVIRDLNAQVSVAGRDPTDVATTWLVEQGLVGRG